MDSIGEVLRTEREKRGLSLEDAHENTKITVQNLAALEEERFDSFPNKVYARAFLRDYANFLGLDSGELLTEYEDRWSPKPVHELQATKTPGRFWRVLGYSLVTLIIAAGIGVGAYFGWQKLEQERKAQVSSRSVGPDSAQPDGAVIPKAPPVAPPKPEAAKAPATAPKPETTPAAPRKLSLEVATLADVWLRVTADGKVAFVGIVPKGQKQTFEGKIISIRAGKAGAVQLKLNGELQPPLEGGSLKIPGEKTFTLPATPAPATPAPTTGTPASPQPGR